MYLLITNNGKNEHRFYKNKTEFLFSNMQQNIVLK